MLRQRSVSDRAARGRWWRFVAAASAAFIVNTDASVVNVALPLVAHRFGTPVSLLQWVMGVYFLAVAAAIPAATWLAERWGRLGVLRGGFWLFAAGSAACGLAPSFPALIAARAFQGLGAAALMSNVNAVVAQLFPGARGRAMGWTATIIAVGTLVGPGLAGALAGWFGWRSVFWITVPIAVGAALASVRLFQGVRSPRAAGVPPPFDFKGAVGFAAAACGLEIGLSDLPTLGGALFLAGAAVAAAGFLWVERRTLQPLIPLRLFTHPGLSAALTAGLAYYGLMMAAGFVLPLYLQQGRRLPVTEAGVLLMVPAATMMLTAPLGGWLADRWTAGKPAQWGLATLTMASLAFAVMGRHVSLLAVVGGLALLGAGSGLVNGPVNALVLSVVPPSDLGRAAGLGALQRAFGRALGISGASLAMALAWSAGVPTRLSALPGPPYRAALLTGIHGAFILLAIMGALGWCLLGRWCRRAPVDA